MKLNDMIFVIENRKGTVEANFLLTLDDTIEMLKQSGEYSMKETAAIFSELGRTMTEPDWAEVYLAGNKTLFMCYCRDGEAISFGMLVAAEISNELGFLNNEEVEMHYELLKMIDVYKMFYLFKNCAMEEVINIMRYDNKRTKIENNKISLVLLKKLGECYSNDYASLLEIDEELIFDKMNYVMRKLSKYIN